MCLQIFIHAFWLLPKIVFFTTFHDPNLSVALTRSKATLRSPDHLYIIRANGNFYQAVGDASFALWSSLAYFALVALYCIMLKKYMQVATCLVIIQIS